MDNISLFLKKFNIITSFLGHNGAVKTTLINILSGIESKDFGDIQSKFSIFFDSDIFNAN